jgi:hypothetical protein
MGVANTACSIIESPSKILASSVGESVQPAGIRVVIYGAAWRDWMIALWPGSRVWWGIPRVKSVVMLPGSPAAEIPAPTPEIPEAVAIPLLEDHIRNRPKRLRSLAPDERSLDVLGDKRQFQDYIQGNGLANLCPEHFSSPAAARFPCILKRTGLYAGHGIAAVASAEQLQSLLDQPPWQGHPFVLQAMVEGDREIVTHCVCKKGQILWHTSYLYTLPPGQVIRCGVTGIPIQPLGVSPSVLRQLQRFLEPLDYTGPCNFDYKLGPDRKLRIMEINPRLGGSLMLPAHAPHLQAALSTIVENALRT